MGYTSEEKRLIMCKMFTAMKYGALGSKERRKINNYVQELIAVTFPVDEGNRKRDSESLTNEQENHYKQFNFSIPKTLSIIYSYLYLYIQTMRCCNMNNLTDIFVWYCFSYKLFEN